MSTHAPIVGHGYSVVCPVCMSDVTFTCTSDRVYGAPCAACGSVVDLRCPSSTLPDGDLGRLPDSNSNDMNGNGGNGGVRYAPEVEATAGGSVSAQIDMVVTEVEREKARTMPTKMTNETKQAFSAQRSQAMAERFSFFFPVTYAIEYLIFGNKPDAVLGKVRIFRKKVPFYGYVNFPVPKTSTSYAAPSTFTLASIIGFHWFVWSVMDLPWLYPYLRIEQILVFFFYFLLFQIIYADPGYIRPGYVTSASASAAAAAAADSSSSAAAAAAANNNNDSSANHTSNSNGSRGPLQRSANGELTLKDMAANERESLWENVNGVPMERKWCSTCEMHRPPRAAHCYLCGLCCYDHDHHCTVVGACVGRRKVELFTCFVTVAATACVMPAICFYICMYQHHSRLSTFDLVCSTILFIPCTFFAVMLSMTACSMWMSLMGEATTRERIQNVYAAKRNPYTRGYLRNLVYHLFQRKVEPSLFTDEFVRDVRHRFAQHEQKGSGATVTCA